MLSHRLIKKQTKTNYTDIHIWHFTNVTNLTIKHYYMMKKKKKILRLEPYKIERAKINNIQRKVSRCEMKILY